MKNRWKFGALAALTIAATALMADELASIVVRPSAMKQGEMKAMVDDGRKVSIERRDNTVEVIIEGAAALDRLEVTREGREIRVVRGESGPSDDERKVTVIGPGGTGISIGLPGREKKDEGKTSEKSEETWYVCPKDSALLKVPSATDKSTFRCPIDGTTMERRKGRAYSVWIGEE